MKIKSVKAKISLISAATIIAGIAAVLIVMNVSLRNLASEQAHVQLTDIGEVFSGLIMETVNDPGDFARTAAADAALYADIHNIDRDVYAEHLRNMVAESDYLDAFGIMFEPDEFDHRDSEFIGSDYGTSPNGRVSFYFRRDGLNARFINGVDDNEAEYKAVYYVNALRAKKPTLTVYTDVIEGEKKRILTSSVPIFDKSGGVIGMTVSDIYLGNLFSALQARKIFETGYAVLVNSSGTVVYSPKDGDIMQDKTAVGLNYPLSEQDSTFAYVKSAVNGEKSLALTIPVRFAIQDEVFYVSVVAPLNEINASVDNLIILVTIMLCVVMVALIAVIYLAVSRMLKPVDALVKSSRMIARGDFNFELPKETSDEIGQMTVSLRDAAYQVNSFVSMIDAMSAQLEQGNIEARIDTHTLSGSYAAAAEGVNKMTGGIIQDVLGFMGCVAAFGEGDFTADIPKLPGKKAVMNESVDKIRERLKTTADEIHTLAENVSDGKPNLNKW